jgi:hypothetical protein
LKLLPGAVIDAVAYLFFKQAADTRERATDLYDRLREDSEKAQALRLVESIDHDVIRAAVKAGLGLHMGGVKSSPLDLDSLMDKAMRADVTTPDQPMPADDRA